MDDFITSVLREHSGDIKRKFKLDDNNSVDREITIQHQRTLEVFVSAIFKDFIAAMLNKDHNKARQRILGGSMIVIIQKVEMREPVKVVLDKPMILFEGTVLRFCFDHIEDNLEEGRSCFILQREDHSHMATNARASGNVRDVTEIYDFDGYCSSLFINPDNVPNTGFPSFWVGHKDILDDYEIYKEKTIAIEAGCKYKPLNRGEAGIYTSLLTGKAATQNQLDRVEGIFCNECWNCLVDSDMDTTDGQTLSYDWYDLGDNGCLCGACVQFHLKKEVESLKTNEVKEYKYLDMIQVFLPKIFEELMEVPEE